MRPELPHADDRANGIATIRCQGKSVVNALEFFAQQDENENSGAAAPTLPGDGKDRQRTTEGTHAF